MEIFLFPIKDGRVMVDTYLKHAGVWTLQMIAVLLIAGVIGYYFYAPLSALLAFIIGGTLLLRRVAFMVDDGNVAPTTLTEV